jgi:protein TonB
VRQPVPPAPPASLTLITKIDVSRLPEQVGKELLAKLPYREGTAITPEQLIEGQKAMLSVDEHMVMIPRPNRETDPVRMELAFTLPGFAPPPSSQITAPSPATGMRPITVGGAVQAANLVKQVRPVYPPEARAVRVSGTVKFNARIGTDGKVAQLEVLPGAHPLLRQAAEDAVSQWEYKPTLLNGEPIEVLTQIDVNFTLN